MSATEQKPGCLSSILGWLGLRPKTPSAAGLPYHLRDDFLSPAELSFYLVLRQSVASWAEVCPKVSLGDLFFARTGSYGQNRSWMNRINRRHVDFLLCNLQTMQPLLGIELDDSSHNRARQQERDLFKDQVFAAARIPLVRIAVQAQYNTRVNFRP